MEALLIRTAPGTGEKMLVDSGRTPGTLWFFHGNGVEHALDPAASREWARAAVEAGLDLVVCETSLARRSSTPLELPWRSGSLAQFWQAMLDSVARMEAVRPESGARPDIPPDSASLHPGYGSGAAFLVRVSDSGDDRFNREILELCLAGAVLEVDLAVCFSDAGLEQLRGSGAAPWRQFPDFELAPLYYAADREIPLDVPARRLSRDDAGQLAVRAGRVIDV